MYTSAASYAIFKNRAWALLNNAAYAGQTVPYLQNTLYNNCYARPQVNAAAAPKAPLTGRPLLQKMTQICDEYGNVREVWNQRDRQNIDVDELRTEYANRHWYLGTSCIRRFFCCCCMAGSDPLSAEAQSSATTYLHAFSNPATAAYATNWRLAANVLPTDLDQAVNIGCDLMDNNPNEIYEFKISAPGTATKPDSFIIYMNNNLATYAGLRAAFQLRIGALQLQGTSAPMTNELAAGLAECSEPPVITWTPDATNPNDPGYHQFSFGTYRCFLTALAYQAALAAAPGGFVGLTQVAFDAQVDAVFARYGVPVANPHLQNAIGWVNPNPEYTTFMNAIDGFYGWPAGTIAGRNAQF